MSGGGAGRLFSQAHRFEKFSYSTPAYCDYCSHVLWGLVKTGEGWGRGRGRGGGGAGVTALRGFPTARQPTATTVHTSCGGSLRPVRGGVGGGGGVGVGRGMGRGGRGKGRGGGRGWATVRWGGGVRGSKVEAVGR